MKRLPVFAALNIALAAVNQQAYSYGAVPRRHDFLVRHANIINQAHNR